MISLMCQSKTNLKLCCDELAQLFLSTYCRRTFSLFGRHIPPNYDRFPYRLDLVSGVIHVYFGNIVFLYGFGCFNPRNISSALFSKHSYAWLCLRLHEIALHVDKSHIQCNNIFQTQVWTVLVYFQKQIENVLPRVNIQNDRFKSQLGLCFKQNWFGTNTRHYYGILPFRSSYISIQFFAEYDCRGTLISNDINIIPAIEIWCAIKNAETLGPSQILVPNFFDSFTLTAMVWHFSTAAELSTTNYYRIAHCVTQPCI